MCVCVWVWVCKRNLDWRERRSLTVFVCCVCVAVSWLASLRSSLLRAESWGHREGPLPLTGPPVASSEQQRSFPSAHPHHAEPYVLSQRHRERKQAVDSQPPAHLTPPLPVLFEFFLLLLMEGLLQPWTQKEKAVPKPWSQITTPLFSVMAEIWHCESDLASVHVGNTFPEL